MLYISQNTCRVFFRLKHNFGEKSATDYSKAAVGFDIVHSFFIA